MPQHYRAYLLRHWQLANGRERVELQHIQTGDRTHHSTLADACAWLTELARAPTQDTTTPAQPEPARPNARGTPSDTLHE